MGRPRLLVGKPILLIIHAHKSLQHTVIYGVVMVSRNLERTNEKDGFKMTALSPIHSDLYARKIYEARRDCYLIDFN